MSKKETIIYRIQSVYDPNGRPKITLPKEIVRKWGFPKKVLVKYDKSEDVVIVKPFSEVK